jgi:hypothetical protein
METQFVFTGLREFKAALRNLPKDLTGEASREIQGTGNAAIVTLRTIYGKHSISGDLQDKVRGEVRAKGEYGAAFVVTNGSKIAWLFDNGSVARHYITKRGKTHDTGTMWGKTPPQHAFVRTMMQARKAMYDALADILRRHGLEVS